MNPKYKLNDKVLINKIFSRDSGGQWIPIIPQYVTVEKVQQTPTLGWLYVLKQEDGKTLPVCYTEEDIIEEYDDEEALWKVWGDK